MIDFNDFVGIARTESGGGLPLVYVATPYGDFNPKPLRERRHRQSVDACGALIAAGVRAVSPVAYSHNVAEAGYAPPDGWYEHDVTLLARSDILCIPEIDGWEESEGINREVEYAKKAGKPVYNIRMRNGYIPVRSDDIPAKPASTGGFLAALRRAFGRG